MHAISQSSGQRARSVGWSLELSTVSLVGTFTKNQEVHHYNTRFVHQYRTIKYKSDKMKYSIKIKGPKIWKEIPQKIKSSLLLYMFEKSTKLLLLNQYFNNNP